MQISGQPVEFRDAQSVEKYSKIRGYSIAPTGVAEAPGPRYVHRLLFGRAVRPAILSVV
jgi:hypothetical protein